MCTASCAVFKLHNALRSALCRAPRAMHAAPRHVPRNAGAHRAGTQWRVGHASRRLPRLYVRARRHMHYLCMIMHSSVVEPWQACSCTVVRRPLDARHERP